MDQWSASSSDASRDPAGRKPELDELLARIPEQNRRNIDELFHGRFTAIRRLDRKQLH
ncbi:MAG TPA: hypothetical protein VGA56_05630 [Opitutaceae bacterium]